MPPSPIVTSQPHDLFETGLLVEQEHEEEPMGYVQLLNQLAPPTQIEVTPKKKKIPLGC